MRASAAFLDGVALRTPSLARDGRHGWGLEAMEAVRLNEAFMLAWCEVAAACAFHLSELNP